MRRVALVAILTVRKAEEASFREFERIAARCLEAHGGRMERTVVADHERDSTVFREFHILSFPSSAGVLAYRQDPRLAAAIALRERAVVQTEVVGGTFGPDYHLDGGGVDVAASKEGVVGSKPSGQPEAAVMGQEPGASDPDAVDRKGADAEGATLAAPVLPARSAAVHLCEVVEENVRKVTALQVAPGQRRFVADNAVSLAEALVSRHAWYRAIYADETPVGFCMLHEEPEKQTYYLWRFMIDARYQGLGFGRQAIHQLVERGRAHPWAAEMLLSLVEGEGGPRPFYESLGFVSTGRYDDGELILRLEL